MSSEANTDNTSQSKPPDANDVLQCIRTYGYKMWSSILVFIFSNLYNSSWPCIHDWIEEFQHNTCPKCNSKVTVDELTPLYLPGSDRKDPRDRKIPPRPAAHAEQAPPPNNNFFGNLFGGNMMGGGGGGFGGNFFIGFGGLGFPLMAFGNMGNMFGGNNNNEHEDPQQQRIRQMMNIIQFVMIAFFILSMFRQY